MAYTVDKVYTVEMVYTVDMGLRGLIGADWAGGGEVAEGLTGLMYIL